MVYIFEMLFQVLLVLLLFLGIFVILSLIFLKKSRGKIIKKVLYFSVPLCSLLILFWFFIMLESRLYKSFDMFIFFIFELEFLGILISIAAIYFTLKKHPRPPYFIYLIAVIIIFFLHIILAGLMADLFRGTVFVTIIAIIVFFSNDFFRGKFKSLLHTIQMNLRNPLLPKNNSFETKSGIIKSEYLPCDHEIENDNDTNEENNEEFKVKKQSKVKFWHARVEITQRPLNQDINKQQNEKTWLKDFFQNKKGYGVELIAHNNFQWAFFIKARTELEALRKGRAILSNLNQTYKGLDGRVVAKPITSKELYQPRIFWEIHLPKPPFLKKISLFEKFIRVFDKSSQDIQLYILWKRAHKYKREKIRNKVEKLSYEDDNTKEEILEMLRENPFKVRIFVASKIYTDNTQDIEYQASNLEGLIATFLMDIETEKGRAYFRRVSQGTWIDILKCNIYSGSILTSKLIDFDIPQDIPLKKSQIIKTQNLKNRVINKDDIIIGKIHRNGVLTEDYYGIHINTLSKSVILAGHSRTGKTLAAAFIVNQLAVQHPDVGVLVVNLGKQNQEYLWNVDTVIKYGDKRLRIPYCVVGDNPDLAFKDTAKYMAAVFGMTNVVPHLYKRVFAKYWRQKRILPKSPWTYYKAVLQTHDKNKYHVKYQQNLRQALIHRIRSVFNDPVFCKVVEYSPETPKWFKNWREGENIYIDISTCDDDVKRFLTLALMQMVKILTPEKPKSFKNIIVFDEAHQLFEKAKTSPEYDDEAVAIGMTRRQISIFLKEFAWKGDSFMFIDQDPSELFHEVTALPNLKICFRVAFPCNTLFSRDPEVHELLENLEDRYAVVWNGADAETCIIRTLDYTPPNKFFNKDDFDVKEININKSLDYKLLIRNREKVSFDIDSIKFLCSTNELEDKSSTKHLKNDKDEKKKPKYKENKNQMKIILREILRDPNYLCLEDNIVEYELIKFLSEKCKIYITENKLKEAYSIYYALCYRRIKEIVEESLQLYLKKPLNLFEFVRQVFSFFIQKNIEIDTEIYNNFMKIEFLNSGFMQRLSGIEKEFIHVKDAFQQILLEFCIKVKMYKKNQKSEVLIINE